jgi:hypothetical protein
LFSIAQCSMSDSKLAYVPSKLDLQVAVSYRIWIPGFLGNNKAPI